ncbi:MAG: WYL domain-containing protein [Bacteroidetes bacterium]|nr:WYL domain-containing protein [Bacteroidota bacterium]
MASNKHALLRYRIIDKRLRNKYKPYPTIDDLMAACEEALYGSDMGDAISKSTIEKDLRAMREDDELGYHAPIKFSKKEKGYFYEDASYSIDDIPLNDDDLSAIQFAARTLYQFRDNDMFKQFRFAIDKIFNRLNISSEVKDEAIVQFVQFDQMEAPSGGEYLPTILSAIKEKLKLNLQYKSFGKALPSQNIVHPYLLKEYKHRWYLICFHEDKKKVITYGLDRVVKLEASKETYVAPKEFDAASFFKYSFGITQIDEAPVEVVLEFKALQGEYIKTQPLHASQQIVKESKETITVKLKITITHELVEQILSYGANVKVIQPDKLKGLIIEKHSGALSQYQ